MTDEATTDKKLEQLHRDHGRLMITSLGVVFAGATLVWLMWTWASAAHAQTEVNENAIESIEQRLAKLDETLASDLVVSAKLREEVSALRVETRSSGRQRERIISLLDHLNERLRDVEQE